MQKYEREIETLQAEKSALESKLGDTSLYDGAQQDRLQALLAEQAANRQALEDAEMAWLRACDELESLERQ